jgi:enolase
LRDGDARYMGKGVQGAVDHVNGEIADTIEGLDALEQRMIDRILCDLDGTDNKARLGANAILGTSLAIAKAAADELDVPLYRYVGGSNAHVLPVPMMNVINGGAHADNNVDMQEFMYVPVGAVSFREALQWGTQCYHTLKKVLHDRKLSTLVGDEGGFAPNLKSNEEAIQLLARSDRSCGLSSGRRHRVGARHCLHRVLQDGAYHLDGEGRTLSSTQMVELLASWCDKYPIVSIEDGVAEEDWDGWKELTQALGSRVQLVGDDLFVTNTERLWRGITTNVANSILVKVNQIGTLTETLDCGRHGPSSRLHGGHVTPFGRERGHDDRRSCVATNCGQIKTGAPARTDRVAKYNQLLRIEEDLDESAAFLGRAAFAGSRGGS